MAKNNAVHFYYDPEVYELDIYLPPAIWIEIDEILHDLKLIDHDTYSRIYTFFD